MRTVQAEERLIESQKLVAIGHLAAGVAHDFNNIIAIVLGYSELLMEKIGPEKELRTQLEAIRSAGARAAGLTRQLLIFSRKQAVQPVVLDLNDVVRDMDELLQPLMHENIKVSVVLGKQIGRVRADAGYIGQVVVNLVVNARDAMPQGGKLTIATSNATLDETYARAHSGVNSGDYVMLNVSDTGRGMTDAVKARLFEVFFTTKAKGQGTGLGLATCRTIVQQAGGHIGVYSEVGVGTTFKVYFPRVDQPVKAASRKPAARPPARGTETLLVVEDDSSLRTLARDLLEAQGYGLLAASNGAEALETARAHQGPPIGLVLTDVIMPVMGGKEMAEWLRTTNPDLKILFTSGYTDDAMSCHGLLRPGVEFIPKPYTPSALVRRVRAMLDQTGDVKSKSAPKSLAVMA
jgi:nitrogen-specific signal transduction histidine kinase/ActR/RegA family two-component response regulator